ncbi:MAG: TetR family transcriptional regulator [Dehalococcoidia bacterium]
MGRLTLPKQRAQETRERIIHAAELVFARHGYGESTVQDIADEAAISMGALYHHFASKEELFRAILEEHVRRDVMEYEPRPASSSREAIEYFVAYQIDHLRQHPELRGLQMELWAQAMREDWAREACANSFRTFRELISSLIGIAQEASVARRDLDIEASATLIEAIFLGMAIQWAVAPDEGDLESIARTWSDMLERFIQTDDRGDVEALETGVTQLFEELREGDES